MERYPSWQPFIMPKIVMPKMTLEVLHDSRKQHVQRTATRSRRDWPLDSCVQSNQLDNTAWRFAEGYASESSCLSISSVPNEKNLGKLTAVVIPIFLMRRLFLALLSSSLGWVLVLQMPAFATDISLNKLGEFSALSASGVELAQQYPSSPELNCSLEEREAALSRFGCSCSTCISAVKQLRERSPLQPLLLDMVQNQQGFPHPH